MKSPPILSCGVIINEVIVTSFFARGLLVLNHVNLNYAIYVFFTTPRFLSIATEEQLRFFEMPIFFLNQSL